VKLYLDDMLFVSKAFFYCNTLVLQMSWTFFCWSVCNAVSLFWGFSLG